MIAARWMLALSVLTLAGGGPSARAQDTKRIAAFDDALSRGDLPGAEKLAADALAANPKDDAARFAVGVAQFLRAVEARMQAFHRHGYRTNLLMLVAPTNLPIPPNPNPEPIDAAKARALLQQWVDELARVEATLAPIRAGDVKLPLHLGRVRLDFDGDGKQADEETLGNLYGWFRRGGGPPVRGEGDADDRAGRELAVTFDRGDVDWLRGYCNLLSAPAEILLAHDFGPWFTHSGSLFFAGAKPPEPFLGRGAEEDQPASVVNILDAIAAVHQFRLPVVEPARMQAAHGHLRAMVDLSRSTWKHYLAEADDDHEWIPNPNQTAATGTRVTPEMVQGWHEVLDELAAILDGKTLVPFWRGKTGERGINLRRVFLEPKPFDLVLWIQGVAAAPYLEAGSITKPETWERITRVFGGEFIGFALWFN